jgi:hypothetical protein
VLVTQDAIDVLDSRNGLSTADYQQALVYIRSVSNTRRDRRGTCGWECPVEAVAWLYGELLKILDNPPTPPACFSTLQHLLHILIALLRRLSLATDDLLVPYLKHSHQVLYAFIASELAAEVGVSQARKVRKKLENVFMSLEELDEYPS